MTEGQGQKLSQTIRIDLIPDIPKDQDKTHKKAPVMSPVTKKMKRPIIVGSKTSVISSYDELLQSLYDGAIVLDASGKIMDVNPRMLDFIRFEKDEVVGASIFDLIVGLDQVFQSITDNLKEQRFTVIEANCTRSDASYFPAEIAVSELTLSEGKRLFLLVRDRTRQRQQEEMLRTEHTAIQNSSTGIAIADVNMEIEYVNPAVAKMWGYESANELSGVNICGFLSDPDELSKILSDIMTDQKSWTGELEAVKQDGQKFFVQISAACNRNSDGDTVGVVLSLMDVSDKKLAEEALREAERQKVMLESLGAACHHLGQPATVLLANLGIMGRRLKGMDADVVDLVKSSTEAAETLGDILHKLNTVNEYKTTRYLERGDSEDSIENRILEIG